MLKGSCVPSHRASSAEVVYHGLRLPAGGWTTRQTQRAERGNIASKQHAKGLRHEGE